MDEGNCEFRDHKGGAKACVNRRHGRKPVPPPSFNASLTLSACRGKGRNQSAEGGP